MTILEVQNLKTYYKTRKGTVKAVDDVSLKLEKGKVLGLVGESGCGKTTACLSIMRMLPRSGEIQDGKIFYENPVADKRSKRSQSNKRKFLSFLKKINIFSNRDKNTSKTSKPIRMNDVDILALSEGEMRNIRGHDIAMVFQGSMNALNPVHKIGRQIQEAIEIHEPEVDEKIARQRVLEMLAAVGIDPERADDYPHQLSGGMQQRALIAVALINNPRVLIADEPVTALDVIVQAQVLKVTKQLQEKLDLSMIMITHDLSVIAEICDTVAVMYAGKIVEYGELRTIFKEPKHPYTQALVNAFPSVVGPIKGLYKIKGTPPDLTTPPSGCRFHPRCPKRMAICDKKVPVNTPTKTGYVACFLYEDDDGDEHNDR